MPENVDDGGQGERLAEQFNQQIPRRNRVDQFSPGEKAIFDAVSVVEAMGAHPRLTDAVVLLGQAREAVADFVDAPKEETEGAPV